MPQNSIKNIYTKKRLVVEQIEAKHWYIGSKYKESINIDIKNNCASTHILSNNFQMCLHPNSLLFFYLLLTSKQIHGTIIYLYIFGYISIT